MRAAEESDLRVAAFDEAERDRELLTTKEALGSVDRVEAPEDVAAFGDGVEAAGIEEFAETGFGRRGGMAETGGGERFAGESQQLLDHDAATRIERVGTFLADDPVGERHARGPQGGGHRDLHREIRHRHGALVVLQKIGERSPLGRGPAGDLAGGGDGADDGIEVEGAHDARGGWRVGQAGRTDDDRRRPSSIGQIRARSQPSGAFRLGTAPSRPEPRTPDSPRYRSWRGCGAEPSDAWRRDPNPAGILCGSRRNRP